MPGHIPWQRLICRCRRSARSGSALTRPDGRPHVRSFCWDEESIYFVTKRATQKARNLAREPWVVAHLGDGDDSHPGGSGGR